jgi:hypothetical protein
MPDAAANPCPNLPVLPPAANLETRVVLKHCLAVHQLRVRVQQLSTPAIVAAMPRPSRRRAGSPSTGSATLALAAWERSLKRPSDFDPRVGMAVQHHHSLVLQPFGWASGRTGRLVKPLALLEDGLIDAPNLDLGRYLRRSVGAYDRLPAGVTTGGEWQPWLLYTLRARERAAVWSSETIRAIRALLDAAAQVRAGARKHFSAELMELIFLEPYCRIGDPAARGLGERPHAFGVLKTLVRLGILREDRCRRDKLFVERTDLDRLASDEPAFGSDLHLVARVASRPQAKAQAA